MQCKNCNYNLESHQNFCFECGAKVIRNRLTVKNLLAHFGETFFNYDNKFLQTFTALFKRPELVIDGYINGVRKRHVNVISYFAIAITISGLYLFILNKFFPEIMNMGAMTQEGMEEVQKQTMNFTQEYQSIIYMLMVPVYALISKIVFFNHKTYNYTEHVVINMYTSAHMAIVSSILVLILSVIGVSFMISSISIIPIQIIYTAYVFKRLFKLSAKSILLKSLLFLFIGIVLYIGFSIIIGMIMYLNGDLQKVIEAQKAAKGG